MTIFDALQSAASPELREWIDAHNARVEPYGRLLDALSGRVKLDTGDAPITGADPVQNWWPGVLERNGIPSDVGISAIIAPLAAKLAEKSRISADIPAHIRVAAAARVLAIVASRDRKAVKDWLHPSNKLSLALFKLVTGQAKPEAWLAATGFDLEAERRAAEAARVAARASEASSAAAKREAAKRAKEDERLNALIRYTVDGRERIGTTREYIDTRIAEGARELEPTRDGLVIRWWLWDKEKGTGSLLNGTIERDYAAREIERRTGVRPTWLELPPVVSYRKDWRRQAAEVVAQESRAHTSASQVRSLPRGVNTKKEAVRILDHWFKVTAGRVQELAVVEDTHHGDKVYFPVIVFEPAAT